MNTKETVALLTTAPTEAEMEEWFDSAAAGYHKARLIEQSGLRHFGHESERVLRLIFALQKERGLLLFDPNEVAAASADAASGAERH